MKQTRTFLIALVLISVSLVLLSKEEDKSEKVGDKVENFSAFDNNNKITFVNFWAAYDAKSREENVRFSQVIKKYDRQEKIKSISISLDNYENIFKEIVRKDQLNFSKIIRTDNGLNSKIAKNFKLDDNFGNFLIDKKGKIIAKNISPEQLAMTIKGTTTN